MSKDMFKFDISQYYAEQDERMNLPDETIDEYMKRVVSFRQRCVQGPATNAQTVQCENQSQSSNAYASSSRMLHSSFLSENAGNATPDPPAALAAASHVYVQIIDLPGEPGRTKKRQGSESLKPAAQDRVIPDQDCARVVEPDLGGIQSISNPQENSLIGKRAEDPQSHDQSSPSGEEIDSFTVDMCEPPVSPSKERITKRKPMSKDTRPTPQKKRRIEQNRSPQASTESSSTQLSPISSFSISMIDPSVKARPLPRKEERSTPSKKKGLDLRPLDEILPVQRAPKQIKSFKTVADPPTSPIEDPSMVSNEAPMALGNQTKSFESETGSKVILDLQQRIAKHKSTKHRDKVVKLWSKPVLVEPSTSKAAAQPQPDKSSIIYVSSSPSPCANPTELAERSIVKSTLKQTRPVAMKSKSKGKNDKPPRIRLTPVEYARQLNATAVAKPQAQGSPSSNASRKQSFRCLEGKNIFFAGGDMEFATESTRKKMDLIVKHGGNLMPEFDPKLTTQIVTETSISLTLKALGIGKLNDIPEHIPTVRWGYVVTALDASKHELEEQLGHATWLHAAFAERMAPVPKPLTIRTAASFYKGKEKAQNSGDLPTGNGNSSAPSTSSTSPPILGQASTASTSAVNIQLPPTSHEPGVLLSPPTSPLRVAGASKQSALTRSATVVHTDNHGRGAEDPLAEFYNQAREEKEIEDGWSSFNDFGMGGSDDEETDINNEPEVLNPLPRQKRGWTCDDKGRQENSECPNQDIIDKLIELKGLHEAKLGDDEHWRSFTLTKAIRALRSHPRRVKDYEEARHIRGIGGKTAKKVEEILQTGGLRRIGYENTKEVQVTKIFQGIYGVGQSIAHKWYLAGCRTLSDVAAGKGGVTLSAVQGIGLQFYDDINDRMPRAEAKAIFDLIRPIALSINSKLFVDIMGSYRRGKADCGDIDILITRPADDGSTHRVYNSVAGVLTRLLQELHSAGILTEDLTLPDDPYGLESTYRGLCRLPGVKGAKRRRIDILTVPWASRGAALLYYTGDDIFNRAIRLKANVLGYSLNQKGLFGNIVRDPRDRRVKMNAGVLVASETEEQIFKILGVPWQEPHERVRG